MTQSFQNKLLTRSEAAEFLGVTEGTLAVWSSTKRYPLNYIKVGRLVKYKMSDLLKFIESRSQHSMEGQDE